MRLKRINLYNNSYIFVSTPKPLKTYNGKMWLLYVQTMQNIFLIITI